MYSLGWAVPPIGKSINKNVGILLSLLFETAPQRRQPQLKHVRSLRLPRQLVKSKQAFDGGLKRCESLSGMFAAIAIAV